MNYVNVFKTSHDTFSLHIHAHTGLRVFSLRLTFRPPKVLMVCQRSADGSFLRPAKFLSHMELRRMDATEAALRTRHTKPKSYISKFSGILNITFELKSHALFF